MNRTNNNSSGAPKSNTVDWASKFNLQAIGDASKASSVMTSQSGHLMDKFKFGGFPKSELGPGSR
jgi:hypothetical protein